MKSRRIQDIVIVIAFVIIVIALTVIAGAPHSNNVASTSIKVMSARGLLSAQVYATSTVYAQGIVVTNSGRFYMAVVAGTSGTTNPVHYAGDVFDGGVTWRFVPKGKRNGLVVGNNSSTNIFINLGGSAIAGAGIRLNSAGGSFFMDDDSYQGDIHAVALGGTSSVTSAEW